MVCWRRSISRLSPASLSRIAEVAIDKHFDGMERWGTYEDVSGVGDGSDDSGSNHELLPSLGQVYYVNSLIVALVHVRSHQTGAVFSAKVGLKRSNERVILGLQA